MKAALALAVGAVMVTGCLAMRAGGTVTARPASFLHLVTSGFFRAEDVAALRVIPLLGKSS